MVSLGAKLPVARSIDPRRFWSKCNRSIGIYSMQTTTFRIEANILVRQWIVSVYRSFRGIPSQRWRLEWKIPGWVMKSIFHSHPVNPFCWMNMVSGLSRASGFVMRAHRWPPFDHEYFIIVRGNKHISIQKSVRTRGLNDLGIVSTEPFLSECFLSSSFVSRMKLYYHFGEGDLLLFVCLIVIISTILLVSFVSLLVYWFVILFNFSFRMSLGLDPSVFKEKMKEDRKNNIWKRRREQKKKNKYANKKDDR